MREQPQYRATGRSTSPRTSETWAQPCDPGASWCRYRRNAAKTQVPRHTQCV